jgi:signal transduction histidine kinase
VNLVIRRLLAPWRTASTWRLLVHAVLDLPLGVALFVPTVVLLAVTLGLSFTLLFALIPLTLLLFWGHIAATVERSRYAALHQVQLADPVPPPPAGSLWTRFKARVTSKPRWKEIAYCVLRLPVGVLAAAVVLVSWCGSFALLGLPFYVSALPGDTAQFGLFGISFGPAAVVASIAGLSGLVAVAPWVTVVVGKVDLALARWLLAPRADAELAAQVARAETGRAAAIGAAEAERRRIERDLHDGAQQRLVALAMDLGAARERLETDPEGGKALVAEAHEEAKAALKEIRDLVRGIHPVILEDRGLDAALSAVVARSPIPVDLDVDLTERPPTAVESAAYFVVSEALANIARHAHAARAHVGIARTGDRLIVEVRDDGIGGAVPEAGTGLAGLAERVAGMGGTMDVLSPRGGPTTLLVELPCGS